MFEKLNIEIEKYDGTISYYNSSLKDLKNASMGMIPSNSEEIFKFRINFPENSENDLESKALSMSFIFTAQNEQSEVTPSSDVTPDVTPETSPTSSPETTPSAAPETSPTSSPEINLDDGLIPGGAVETPMPTVTPEPSVTPSATSSPVFENFNDEEIPKGAIPKTGGFSAEILYIVGLIILIVGLKIKRN